MIDRNDFIKGLRDLVEFWEQHPEVPVPQYGYDISVHTLGEDDVAAFRYVEDCAAAMGVVAGPPRDGSAHYAARLAFGPVVLEVIAVPVSVMADHRERTRLGEEALAAKRAAEAELVAADGREGHAGYRNPPAYGALPEAVSSR